MRLGVALLLVSGCGRIGFDVESDGRGDGAGTIVPLGSTVYVKASSTDPGDQFGVSSALSGDGNVLAIGSYVESSGTGAQTDNSVLGAGAVYVYERTAGVWSFEAYLKPKYPDVTDRFGVHIALSGDGSTLVVASFEDSAASGINGDETDNSASGSGAVYVFERSGTTWLQTTFLKASNSEALDSFGEGLAISSDGSTIVVGADLEDSSTTIINGDQANNTRAGSRASARWRAGAAMRMASRPRRPERSGRSARGAITDAGSRAMARSSAGD